MTPSVSWDSKSSYKQVQIQIQSLIYNGKECRVLLVRDVSEIREKAKLRAEVRMLQHMQSIVSHEMITPLRCITNLTGGLENRLKFHIHQDP